MKHLMNFPVYDGCLRDYGRGMADLAADCERLGIDGIEAIWDHMPYTEEMPPKELVVGYHLLFFSCWLDFWNGNRAFLEREYGSMDMVREYYRGTDRSVMLERHRDDLQRAIDLEAEYVVLHASEVSLEECFTYRFNHTDEEVIDATADLANQMLDGMGFKGTLLLENQWWPGLTFTRPEMTRRLLERVEYGDKGIMLDTGHLLHTNTRLRSEAEAARYIDDMCREHGDLVRQVRGLHLHQSVTGAYVEAQGFAVPDDFADERDYWKRYTLCYNHILQIDKHQPWTDPAIAPVVCAIEPEWVNHELSAWPRAAHVEALSTQLDTLRAGGLSI